MTAIKCKQWQIQDLPRGDGERAEREHTGVWGRRPQRDPEAKTMVEVRGRTAFCQFSYKKWLNVKNLGLNENLSRV